MARSTKEVTVHEVVYSCDGPGEYGDGVAIARFAGSRLADAEGFARVHVHYGARATVATVKVPRHVAQRWGVA